MRCSPCKGSASHPARPRNLAVGRQRALTGVSQSPDTKCLNCPLKPSFAFASSPLLQPFFSLCSNHVLDKGRGRLVVVIAYLLPVLRAVSSTSRDPLPILAGQVPRTLFFPSGCSGRNIRKGPKNFLYPSKPPSPGPFLHSDI